MTLLLAGVIGLAGGVLAGMFGVGGGILFVPTLVFVLGLTQLHAEASSLLAILPTAAVGTWRLRSRGLVAGRIALVIGLFSILGVQGGVAVAESLPEDALRRLFGVLLIVMAVQIAWRARNKPQSGEAEST
jgi:uncharacterized membrane protein YfcA